MEQFTRAQLLVVAAEQSALIVALTEQIEGQAARRWDTWHRQLWPGVLAAVLSEGGASRLTAVTTASREEPH